MYFLFIDTSSSNFLALFKQGDTEKDFVLIERREPEEKASFIQFHIYSLLNDHDLDIKDIACLYYGAGPGSYTGMRITQGFVGTLKILGIPTKGVYLYEAMANDHLWISSAFKGEFFIFHNGEKKLVLLNEAQEIIQEQADKVTIYSHYSENLSALDVDVSSVFNLICDDFYKVVNIAGERSPYYYRPLDVEFSKGVPKKK